MIVCYVKRAEAQGTWVASHLTWLIRTFWFSLLWTVIGWIVFWVLLIVFLIGPLLAVCIWAVTAIWILYRVIRGYLLFKDSQPVPGIVSVSAPARRSTSPRSGRPTAPGRRARPARAPRSGD